MNKEDEILREWGRKREEIINIIEEKLNDVDGPFLFKKIMQLNMLTKDLEELKNSKDKS